MVALRADPPTNYYATATGRTGADLRATLHAIIRSQHSLPYSGSPHPNTADALEFLDRDPQNTNYIVGIYSRYLVPATNIGSASTNWNREHMWCQSYGADSGPPQTDLHHMRPEQASVNSSRGNNFYDVSNPSAAGYKTYTNTITGQIWSRTSLTWEPPDVTKGEIARSLLYMTVRYTGDAANEPDMILTDNTNLIVSGNTCILVFRYRIPRNLANPTGTDQEIGLVTKGIGNRHVCKSSSHILYVSLLCPISGKRKKEVSGADPPCGGSRCRPQRDWRPRMHA